VRGLKVGDRVAYAGPVGGYCRVRLIEAGRLVLLADAISFDQAAAMMLQSRRLTPTPWKRAPPPAPPF
jgi:NADPH:quinone reductase-like Zn-dependent oxidoreductase